MACRKDPQRASRDLERCGRLFPWFFLFLFLSLSLSLSRSLFLSLPVSLSPSPFGREVQPGLGVGRAHVLQGGVKSGGVPCEVRLRQLEEVPQLRS